MKKFLFTGLIFTHFVMALSQDLNLGLVGYFPFNGNANDESITNMDGVVSNAILGIGLGDEPNGCYVFNGVDSYINCGTDDRDITNTLTISFWVKTSSTVSQHVASKYNYDQDKGFVPGVYNGYALMSGRDGSGTYYNTGYSNTYISDNQWHHILGIVDGNDWYLYVDCQPEGVAVSSTVSPNLQCTDPWTLGKYYQQNNYHYSGSLDEVRLYNRVLSATEIAMLCDYDQFFLGEEELTSEPTFNLSPNPASGLVQLNFKDQKSLQVMNMLGEVVITENISGLTTLQLDITMLTKGQYIITLVSSTGVLSEKLVIP